MKYILSVVFFAASAFMWFFYAPQKGFLPSDTVMNIPSMFISSTCFVSGMICLMSALSDAKLKKLYAVKEVSSNEKTASTDFSWVWAIIAICAVIALSIYMSPEK